MCYTTTNFTTAALRINSMRILGTVSTEMPTLLTNKTSGELRTSILTRLRARKERMPCLATIVTQFLIRSLIRLVRTVLETMPTSPAEQTNLVLFPLLLFGAVLGDVVVGLADETAVAGFHARDSKGVFSGSSLTGLFVGVVGSF